MSSTTLKVEYAGLPDELCFEGTFADAMQQIISKLRVIVPDTITNVVVSNQEPTDSQRNYVWFRLDNSGSFIGVFIYSQGNWQQVFPVPNALSWIYGSSDTPPVGYIAANDAAAPLTTGEKAALEALWYPAGGPIYTLYQVIFIGF